MNDTYGHAAGDHVLKISVQRWMNALPSDGLLSRTGGDEFVVWFGRRTAEQAQRLAQQLHDCLGEPISVPGLSAIAVSCSIGIAPATTGELFASVVERADRSLYDAKSNGRDTVSMSLERPGRHGIATG